MTQPEWFVLVVEDEPDGQEVIAELLKYENINTDRAQNADEALNKLAKNKKGTYTAILIDLALPGGMNGIDLMREIRENPKYDELPCIAITAFHTTTVRYEALAAGFDAYFSKPLDVDTFAKALTEVIKKGS